MVGLPVASILGQLFVLAARDALNDRLSEGVDVELSGGGTAGTTSVDWVHLAQVGRHPRLVLDTDRGTVVLELDTEAAPQTVQRITTTASQGLYDGVPFHHVVVDRLNRKFDGVLAGLKSNDGG